ncbi:hypothetical protein E4U60_004091 [Claviceps pazoutovae]|uniref:GDP/GTP exchange factor Sec2 N-terminal domain-containing protein n=1 Tax=Claviceps pazoutovae TaxID=1649127 RepID=A0A9P7SKF2_9HYPO|nr:hypothetical protein E4U60_004091 [Claviceps pazoutovae]
MPPAAAPLTSQGLKSQAPASRALLRIYHKIARARTRFRASNQSLSHREHIIPQAKTQKQIHTHEAASTNLVCPTRPGRERERGRKIPQVEPTLASMSETTVLAMATAVQTSYCCPNCGSVNIPPTNITTTTHDPPIAQEDTPSADLLLRQAQSRIAQLEAQVTELNAKAASTVSRWADYEAELHKLRSTAPPPPPPQQQQQQQQQRPSTPRHQTDPPTTTQQSSPPSILQQGTSRISSLLYPQKSTPNLRRVDMPPPPPPASPGGASTEDLMEALSREQTLRREAEGRLSATSKEVEELSVSLFEQANEMVADERRARARLEERVGELERRDKEKKKRLERLEGAMGRIEKARHLLEA